MRGLDREALYLRLPVPIQNLACSMVGYQTEWTRYNSAFERLLAEAVARTHLSAEEIAAFRDRRLADVLNRAARTSAFYRRRLSRGGATALEVRSLDDLAAIPILDKLEAQANMADLGSDAVQRRSTRSVHTSGTTGGALRFGTTIDAVREQWAIWWRYRGWHGIRRGTWCALFTGRSIVPARQAKPPFWRVNIPGRQVIFSGYHLAPGNLGLYAHELRRRRPPWLHGYPSILALLAAYLVESRFDLGYEPQWVTLGAENLLLHQAELIERAFGVRPIQHYGLAEGVANISECELGTLHVDEDFAAVEFVPTAASGVYRIVGTNLTNLATPLIRYDTGDLAVLRADASCTCGRPGRVIDRIDGRREDYVVLANNVRIGRMDHIFKDMVNVREAQIYQRVPGRITIRVVRGDGFTIDDEQALIRETVKRVGRDAVIDVEYHSSLPRSPTGKLRFVVSDIRAASIDQVPSSTVTDGGSSGT